MKDLSNMELDVLKVCGGYVVQLPYNKDQEVATEALVQKGLIQRTYEDDQPTAYTTALGDSVLKELGRIT